MSNDDPDPDPLLGPGTVLSISPHRVLAALTERIDGLMRIDERFYIVTSAVMFEPPVITIQVHDVTLDDDAIYHVLEQLPRLGE